MRNKIENNGKGIVGNNSGRVGNEPSATAKANVFARLGTSGLPLLRCQCVLYWA